MADDILLLYVETVTGNVLADPTGYLNVTDSPQDTAGTAATSTKLYVWWKRAGGSETAPTVTSSGNHVLGRMVGVSGCITTGDPWDVTSGSVDTAATTAVSIPGDTTTVDECLCLAASASNLPDAISTTEFGAPTNASLTSLTEQVDDTASVGNGGGLHVVSGVKATAGVVSATTCTSVTTPNRRAYHFVALKPPGVAFAHLPLFGVRRSHTTLIPFDSTQE